VTTEGLALDSAIAAVRQKMGLADVIGCSQDHYYVGRDIDTPGSLYGLYVKTVAPASLFTPAYNESQILVSGTGL
jgi:hypothetical protein